MDDTAIVGMADADGIITSLTTAAELTIQTFQSHGLQINMKENKTDGSYDTRRWTCESEDFLQELVAEKDGEVQLTLRGSLEKGLATKLQT